MAKSRRFSFFGFVCATSALLLTTLCGRARAEGALETLPPSNEAEQPITNATQPMQPGLGMVRVHVAAGQRAFSVFFGHGRVPIAACSGPCDFWAWPGKYRVRVRDGEGPGADAQLGLRVARTGEYSFVPAHGAAQNAGIYLGVSGPVIGIAGLIVTAASAFRGCNDGDGSGCDKPTSFYVGLGALGLGAVMTSAGWLLYAANRARFEFAPAARPPLTPRVALISMPRGGLGLGASVAF